MVQSNLFSRLWEKIEMRAPYPESTEGQGWTA